MGAVKTLGLLMSAAGFANDIKNKGRQEILSYLNFERGDKQNPLGK
jgi:hypothetical protein